MNLENGETEEIYKAPLDSLDKTNEYGQKILGGIGTMTAATFYRDYKISNGKLYFLFSSQAGEIFKGVVSATPFYCCFFV